MSLIAAITEAVKRSPTKIAIACHQQSWTYGEWDRLTDNIAGNILAAGVEPGDRVAFHLTNGPELAMGLLGCLKAGCAVVPINTRLKGREIDYILRQSGTAFYVGQRELYDPIQSTCSALSELTKFFVTTETDGQTASFHDLCKPSAWGKPIPEPAPDQVAAIFYTSGTTARPKGVIRTHANLEQLGLAMRQTGLTADEIVLSMSSMMHILGSSCVYLAGLMNGATVVLTKPFDFVGTLDAIETWRCTLIYGMPVMYNLLIDAQKAAPRDISSIRLAYGGGDSVSPALQRNCHRSIAPIVEVYGSTEIVPVSWNRPGEVRVGSIGRPADGVDVRLVDDRGEEVGSGETGEIQVRAAHLMQGYWQDPDATSAAFDNGWFRTGDLGRQDEDGYYWFAGRKKEIIVRGGSNISPQEVEAVLHEHPAVAEVGVVGRPHPVWGETVVAHVVLQPGRSVDEVELISFARDRLAEYKLPENVVFQSDLPKGLTGKVQRSALREQYDCVPSVS
jgi:long-chain acyl-CoA synthetase